VGTRWTAPHGTREVVAAQRMADGVKLVVTTAGPFFEHIPLDRIHKDRQFDEESARQSAARLARLEAERLALATRRESLVLYLDTLPAGVVRSRTDALLSRGLWLRGDAGWRSGECGFETVARLLDSGCTVATDTSPISKRARYILRRPGGTFWVIPKTFGLFANWYLTHRAEERPAP